MENHKFKDVALVRFPFAGSKKVVAADMRTIDSDDAALAVMHQVGWINNNIYKETIVFKIPLHLVHP